MRFKSTFLFIFPLYLFQWSLDADGSLRNARGPFFFYMFESSVCPSFSPQQTQFLLWRASFLIHFHDRRSQRAPCIISARFSLHTKPLPYLLYLDCFRGMATTQVDGCIRWLLYAVFRPKNSSNCRFVLGNKKMNKWTRKKPKFNL